jgi:Flp pilus assembly protein TadG
MNSPQPPISTRPCRDRLRDERGQAIVETAIVIVLLVTLAMGVVEFGRAFLVANMITQAARTGARAASVTPSTNRNSSGMITSTTSLVSLVDGEIRAVLGATTNNLTIVVNQGTSGGIPIVSVNVNGPIPYIFNLVAGQFAVNRTVTFRDEGR